MNIMRLIREKKKEIILLFTAINESFFFFPLNPKQYCTSYEETDEQKLFMSLEMITQILIGPITKIKKNNLNNNDDNNNNNNNCQRACCQL